MDIVLSDHQLFHRIANGDEQAFRTIFHRHNARLFHTILKIVKSRSEAEEIIQELFLKLWLKRETLNEIGSPAGWLNTVAANLALDALRKHAKQRMVTTLTEEDSDRFHHLPNELELREVRTLIDEAVSHLPESRKKVFLLSRVQGMSRSEIAKELNISESTVKNQLTAALKFVQEYMHRKDNIYLPLVLLGMIGG